MNVHRYAIASILACGLYAVYVVGLTIIVAPWEAATSVRESLVVFKDGTVVVLRKGEQEVTTINDYRHLDGAPVSEETLKKGDVYGVSLGYPKSAQPSQRTWPYRVAATFDRSLPPVYWYAIRDDFFEDHDGHLFFQGFDSLTNREVGFIGKDGFQSSRPTLGESFPVSNAPLMQIVDGYDLRFDGWLPFIGSGDYSQSGFVLLLSEGNTLWVDLRERAIRRIEPSGKGLSIAWHKERDVFYVLARTDEDIRFVSPTGELLLVIPIPETMRRRDFYLWFLDGGNDFVMVDQDAHGALAVWLDQEGQVTREESVTFASESDDRAEESWLHAAGLPVPASVTYQLCVEKPASSVKVGTAPDLATARRQWLEAGWPALATVTIASILAAVWTYRRHRLLIGPGAVGWAVFVFLLGPFGVGGYLLHRRWPVREKCPHCGNLVPRDRLECSTCHETFPLPEPNGTEILVPAMA